MRLSLLTFTVAAALAAQALANVPADFRLPSGFDPWNANYNWSAQQLDILSRNSGAVSTPLTRPQKQLPSIKREGAVKKTLFVAAQTFYKNYVFNFDGGEIKTYDIEVTIDGDKATISNMFNLAAQSTEYMVGVDYDVTGTYDAASKTITIPTSTQLEDGTIAGTIGESYTEILVAGTVNESGQFAPDPELVFHVEGDFEGLTTTQHVGIMHYFTAIGMTYGMQTIYRDMQAWLPTDQPKILSYNSQFDLGKAYTGTEASVTATYVNMSSASADYAITMESDGNSFSASPAAGMADAKTPFDVTYTFHPTTTGEFEGLATIEYEGTSAGQPIVVLFNGSSIDYPDYSPAVKEGDFTFTTNIDYPFEITTDAAGNTVARSTANGRSGSSKLTVNFEVPEGSIGTFSWKGESVNTGYYYQNAAGYFIDDADYADKSWNNPTDDISGTLQFAPGKHSVRFQYDCIYYTGDEKNGMTVYDLSLVNTKAEAKAAEVETPVINMGSFLIKDDGNPVQGNGTIRLRNKGSEPLTVTAVKSDNPALTATAPGYSAALLEAIDIPVTLSTDNDGEINATLTISTSAGDLTANVTALVRRMADFSALVTEGAEYVTGYSTNETAPFDMKDGVAVNANSGMADTQYSDSWVCVNFTVPEGKAARLEWDGHHYGGVDPEADPAWAGTDYAMFEFNHPLMSGTMNLYDYDSDASSAIVAADPGWASQLVCVPGNHFIKFHYVKNGDGFMSDEDRLEISNLRIVVEDFPEYGCKADKDEVTFEPTYVGPERYTTAVIKLHNTGSQVLKVTGTRSAEPFYGTFIEGAQASWDNDIELGIWFYPSTEGEFEGDVVFETTAGDVTVHCYGKTNSADGIILVGDFEDKANGWATYDADGDGNCWNLGYNLWGKMPEWVHSGYECLASPSQGTAGEALMPDNWAISPIFNLPADGKAVLTWWVAAHHTTRFAEHYSVYCEKSDDVADSALLPTFTPLYSETLVENDGQEWRQVAVEFEGDPAEAYSLLFRHHDCSGEYVLKLDDVFVYTADKWNELSGVTEILTGAEKVSTEIYDVAGVRHNTYVTGINIVTDTYADGRKVTRKVVIK